MMTFVVVKPEVFRKTSATVGDVGVIFQIDLLVLHRSPESFDHDIVERSAPTVHADLERAAFERPDELVARILRSLVRVEDSGTSDSERVLHTMDAELAVERRRKLPRDHVTTVPVEDRR